MDFFNKYTSNTVAGSANQYFFEMEEGEVRTARAFYKITAGGEHEYSLLFSGILDGTYRRISYANDPCGGWTIHAARVGRCASIPDTEELDSLIIGRDMTVEWISELTFGGNRSKSVGAELFSTAPVRLEFDSGEYLCVELTFSGRRLPCHPETQLPVYRKVGGVWRYSTEMPLPAMIGCDRRVKERVAYLGDSITQGCGAGLNSYKHWNAYLSAMLPEENSYWNLGIGYGTARDAATDGVLLGKAKKNDTVFLCYGVNDINSGHDAETISKRLDFIVDKLYEAGCRVILQTVPPFNYPPEKKAVWLAVNEYIKAVLSKKVAFVFDNGPILSQSADAPEMAKFGGHPNAEGCKLWAEALYSAVRSLF